MIPAIYENLLAEVAGGTPHLPYDGPSPQQVDVVYRLRTVRRLIDALSQDVMMRGDGPWLQLADQLEEAAERCRNIERFTIEQRLLQGRGGAA